MAPPGYGREGASGIGCLNGIPRRTLNRRVPRGTPWINQNLALRQVKLDEPEAADRDLRPGITGGLTSKVETVERYLAES
jgi:hypothetical protein